MPIALWLVGPPGVGKTTLARHLLGQPQSIVPTPKLTICANGVAAGHYTGATFDGADTVPYNGASAVIEAWRALFSKHPLFLLDGDRFSDATSKAQIARATGDLRCILLETDHLTLAARRRARGTAQNATWAQGRATKARNFFNSFPADSRVVLEAADPNLFARAASWLSRTESEVGR